MKAKHQSTKGYNMKKRVKTISIYWMVIFLSACSIPQTAMSPSEVHNTLPKYSKSTLLTEAQVKNMDCSCLIKDRNYVAPIGLTVKDDLKNGAKGIDEWVLLDGGNSYVLRNFQWKTVGYNTQDGTSATQLYLDFDTYSCK